MKTAMQELIEYLEKVYYVKEIIDWDEYKKELLEKEKKQIIEARDGLQTSSYTTGKDYYELNYNQNK